MDKDGLWECAGRLKVIISEFTRYPILLSIRHDMTVLNKIFQDCHIAIKHSGVSETLACNLHTCWIIRNKILLEN